MRPEGRAASGQGNASGGTRFTRDAGLGLSSEGALRKSGRPSPGRASWLSVPAVGAPGGPNQSDLRGPSPGSGREGFPVSPSRPAEPGSRLPGGVFLGRPRFPHTYGSRCHC